MTLGGLEDPSARVENPEQSDFEQELDRLFKERLKPLLSSQPSLFSALSSREEYRIAAAVKAFSEILVDIETLIFSTDTGLHLEDVLTRSQYKVALYYNFEYRRALAEYQSVVDRLSESREAFSLGLLDEGELNSLKKAILELHSKVKDLTRKLRRDIYSFDEGHALSTVTNIRFNAGNIDYIATDLCYLMGAMGGLALVLGKKKKSAETGVETEAGVDTDALCEHFISETIAHALARFSVRGTSSEKTAWTSQGDEVAHGLNIRQVLKVHPDFAPLERAFAFKVEAYFADCALAGPVKYDTQGRVPTKSEIYLLAKELFDLTVGLFSPEGRRGLYSFASLNLSEGLTDFTASFEEDPSMQFSLAPVTNHTEPTLDESINQYADGLPAGTLAPGVDGDPVGTSSSTPFIASGTMVPTAEEPSEESSEGQGADSSDTGFEEDSSPEEAPEEDDNLDDLLFDEEPKSPNFWRAHWRGLTLAAAGLFALAGGAFAYMKGKEAPEPVAVASADIVQNSADYYRNLSKLDEAAVDEATEEPSVDEAPKWSGRNVSVGQLSESEQINYLSFFGIRSLLEVNCTYYESYDTVDGGVVVIHKPSPLDKRKRFAQNSDGSYDLFFFVEDRFQPVQCTIPPIDCSGETAYVAISLDNCSA